MLHIAQCTDSFLPISDGVGRVSYEYARLLAGRGHESYVITPMGNGGYRGGQPFETLDFYDMSILPGSKSVRAGVAALDMHYTRRTDAIPFDIIHTHSMGPAGQEATRLAARLHQPLIGSVHSKYIQGYLNHPEDMQTQLNFYFTMDYFKRCDELWVDCEEAARLLTDKGYPGRIFQFENGTEFLAVSEKEKRRIRSMYHLTDAPVLLTVGTMDKSKDLPRILEAASLLRRSGTPFQLVFAGRGPDEQAAKSLALEQELIGQTRFAGQVDSEDLAALYAVSALLLFPFHGVGASLSINEAAAQGTPSLVVEGSTFASRIADGFNGLVCGDSAQSIAETIRAYLTAPERASALRQNALETLPLPWPRAVDAIEERYEKVKGMDRAALTRKWGFFRKELQQVDQTLEKRAMDLMWKFLKQDFQHLYAYPHGTVESLAEPGQETMLPRSTPEEQGVSSRALNGLVDAINGDAEASAMELLVVRNGTVIAEGSWTPYERQTPHQLYSLSKSITSTAIGMLVDEGRLDIDERLADIFPDKMPEDAGHPAWSFTVRHLLNMSTGSLFNEVGSALGADWEKEFLHAAVKFPAGDQFDYNSMNTYMLSAIVRRKTGMTMTAYLTPRLYEPLGIPVPLWETCPNGTEKGGWGLMLTGESVAKIGQLYLNKGRWTVDGEERQLISRVWVEAATVPQIDTPNGEITYGYGHQIWMTAHPGAFLFNGAFGQYMLALPDKNALVVLFSGTARLFANGGVMDYVDRAFARVSDRALPPDPAGVNALAETLSALTVRYRPAYYDPARVQMPLEELGTMLDGRIYTFEKNAAALLPSVLMNVENNYSPGLKRVAFRKGPEGVLGLEMDEGPCRHKLTLAEGTYTAGAVTQKGDTYAIRCGVVPERNENGESMLHVHVHFIETPFTRILHFLFRGDGVTLICDEMPSVKDASAMLMELAGLNRAQVVRTLMPLLKRERMQSTLRTFTTATAQGKL